MMTEMDRVWARIKQVADALAVRRQELSIPQAMNVVSQIFYAEAVPLPDDEALRYLASELIAHASVERTQVR